MYVSLKDAVYKLVAEIPPGVTFSTKEIYTKCNHRGATMIGIAFHIGRCPMVENITQDKRVIHKWRRIE